MMPWTYLESTLAVSPTDSLLPIWISVPLMKRAWPPSWFMPISKEIRVRAELLSKIMASDWLARAFWYWAGDFLTFAANTSRPSTSFGENSSNVNKCLGWGATGSSLSRLEFFCGGFAEFINSLVDVGLVNDEWGREPEDILMGRADQQPLLDALGNHGSGLPAHFHAQDHADSPDFVEQLGKFLHDSFELLFEDGAVFGGNRQQILANDRFNVGNGRRAHNGVSSEGGSMVTRLEPVGNLVGHHQGSHGQAAT